MKTRRRIDRTLIRKIRLAYMRKISLSEIARYFGVSRDVAMYWLGRLKYKPKELRGASEDVKRVLNRKWQLEFTEEKRIHAIYEKKRINKLILAGRNEINDPVELAHRLREKFKLTYDVLPEDI